jgi:hypothetical protein
MSILASMTYLPPLKDIVKCNRLGNQAAILARSYEVRRFLFRLQKNLRLAVSVFLQGKIIIKWV